MKALAKSHLVMAICASMTLAGCVKSGDTAATAAGAGPEAADAAADGSAAQAPSALTLVERDVEAPDVFQVSEEGLWDGRPSLGGVWVAHASVKDPERVMIRNPANGKFIMGALFRREFENPGPKVQVSSDAAEALGMLAGQPAKLNIVALRREELPDGGIPADPADPAAPAGEPVTGDKAGADSQPAAPDGAAPATAAAAAADGELPLAGQPAAAAPAKKTGWSLFGKRKPKSPATDAPSEAATAATAAAGAIASQPLDPLPGSPAPAAKPADKPADKPVEKPAKAPAPASTPAAEPAAATQTATADLKRAYVQIGIFSTEANAMKAGEQMQKVGMTATLKTSKTGKPLWRVIVGPAATEAERDALLARVKGLGYPDAYVVSK